jgi:RNA polymerase sigma-70 factor (ECF subfamily)
VKKNPAQDVTTRGDPPDGGDLETALERLYERHAADVERWVHRLAGPRADHEDLIHDVFVVALRRRSDFRGEATVRTWLFRITHHVVRNRRQRDFVRRLLFARHGAELASAPPEASALDEIERRERCARLYAALDRLPDGYRTALVLYEIEGLSGEEVAELLDVDVGTVWVRLHRGRAKLLAALAREEPR